MTAPSATLHPRDQLNRLFAFDSVASIIFGILALQLSPRHYYNAGQEPEPGESFYNDDAAHNETLRFYGCLRLACGWILWHVRRVDDGVFRRHVCEALFMSYLLQALTVLRTQFTDRNVMINWVAMIILLTLSAAYGSFVTDAAKKSVASTPLEILDESKSSSETPVPDAHSNETSLSSLSVATAGPMDNANKDSSFCDTSSANTVSPISVQRNWDTDSDDVVRKMVEQIDIVLAVADSRKGSYQRGIPRPINGPCRWVLRYMDYSSKYGLGFLLNTGGCGVYFNDSSKCALEAHGETFQYIERKKDDNDNDDRDYPGRRPKYMVETYTLASYPLSLKKKVKLLIHFRNYLIEQQNKAAEEDMEVPVPTFRDNDSDNPVFVKKWIRTKHAIWFRLSDHTIQVIFNDQTEILLTPDTRFVTYVDKSRVRATYSLTDELIGTSSELEKRLRYVKDITSQLLTAGQQQQASATKPEQKQQQRLL